MLSVTFCHLKDRFMANGNVLVVTCHKYGINLLNLADRQKSNSLYSPLIAILSIKFG